MYIVTASKKKLPLYQITTQRVMFCHIYWSFLRMTTSIRVFDYRWVTTIIDLNLFCRLFVINWKNPIQNRFFLTRQYWTMNENNSFLRHFWYVSYMYTLFHRCPWWFFFLDQIIFFNKSTKADMYLKRTVCVFSNQLFIGLNVCIIKNVITSVNYRKALVLIIIIL